MHSRRRDLTQMSQKANIVWSKEISGQNPIGQRNCRSRAEAIVYGG